MRVNYTAARGFDEPVIVRAGHPLVSFAVARQAASAGLGPLMPPLRKAFRASDVYRPDSASGSAEGPAPLVTGFELTDASVTSPTAAVHIATDRIWQRDDGRRCTVRVWHALGTLCQN